MLYANAKVLNKIKQFGFNYITRRQLASLSKQQLDDIGISHEEAQLEFAKSTIKSLLTDIFSA